MNETILELINYSRELSFIWGYIFIILESIIPILPLSVFIAINTIAFGPLFGFLISYSATIIGCLISFTLSKKIYDIYYKKRKEGKLIKLIKKIKKLNFSTFVIIIALPFTPAFLINISSGIVKMNFKRFLFAILIGKLSIIYFWSFIGESLLESVNNPTTLIKIAIIVLIVYIISKIVSRKSGIE